MENSQLVETPETTELQTKGQEALKLAREITVSNDVQLDMAGRFQTDMKLLAKNLENAFYLGSNGEKDGGPIPKAHAAHKAIMALYAEQTQPLKEAMQITSGKIGSFLAEKEKQRMLEQKKLEEEARLQAAVQAEELGAKKTEVNNILTGKIFTPTPVVAQIAKPANISLVKRYDAEVVDLMALVKAIVIGIVPVQAVQPDTIFLRQQAISLKESLKYPGVKLIVTNTTATRLK